MGGFDIVTALSALEMTFLDLVMISSRLGLRWLLPRKF